MSKRKYSTIWLHFDDEDGQRAKCKHCQASLSIADGCHSNLKRHLKAKHSIKPLNVGAQMPTSEDIVKFEVPFDDQSLGSTEITTQHELTEFVSTSPPKRKANQKDKGYCGPKRKYSVIWLYFEDKGGQRAKCKYCKATLSFSGGSHGNLRRHMKLKHPLTHLNVEEQVPIPEEILNVEDPDDEDPLTNTKIRIEKQQHQTTEFFSKAPSTCKVEQTVRKDRRVYFKPSPKKKYSAIWAHFEDSEYQRAMCRYCKTTISCSGGSHGNLKRHLKLRHPHIHLNAENKLWKPRQILNFEETVEQEPLTTISTEQIDRQVLKMIVKGFHSLQLLEEPEFQKLIHDVSNCPGYTLPSKKTLSHSLIPNVHMELLEDIKGKLESATAVCFTTDGWTSTTNVYCLAVTAHYINTDTMLTSHLLACKEFENRYTAENLCYFLKNVISDFEITKVTAIVSANEPNIVAAIHQGEWQGICCFAHSLNLTVQTAIAEIADTINKVKKIVEYFHTNADALNELQVAQKQMNLPEIKLKQDVPERWNSTFEMLRRVNQIKDAVAAIVSLNRPDLMPSTEDWQIIGETIPILKPFYEVTVEISEEKYFILSKVTVLYNLLDRHIAKCLPSNEEVTAMVINLQMGIASCFGNLEKNKLYAESTILDPRFKRKGFRNEASYEQALENLRNKLYTIELPNVEEETVGIVEGESLWEAYDSEFNESVAPDNNTAACIREFDKYMNEEYLDRRKDPLFWWKERKHLYPRLYSYALKRLCIMASSVPCERMYSAAGQIISERRTLLKPKKIERIILLHNM